ncbi:hypothetical protein FGF1_25890 [Flavobacteriaceae bacterium GF1]
MEKLLLELLYRNRTSSVSEEEIKLQLISHPEYPSLKSVTDTLDYFEIGNIAAKVPKDALSDLPNSFLTLIKETDRNEELVLISKKKGKIVLQNQRGEKLKILPEAFLEIWTGTLIAVEKEEHKTIGFKLFGRPQLLLGVLAVLILGGMAIADMDILTIVYTFLSCLGLTTSVFIIKTDVGTEDSISKKICNMLSSKPVGCSAVISSKSSVLIKNISLGDASIIYFSSVLLTTVTLGIHGSLPFTIAILSLPMVAYSIYVQATQLKAWCVLCLILSTILVGQFTILVLAHTNWQFPIAYTLKALSLGLLITLFWLSYKKHYLSTQKLFKTKKEYLGLKRNYTFFKNALEQGKVKKLTKVEEHHSITFGSTSPSRLQITAYTNPLCGFCTEAFKAYHKILNMPTIEVSVELIFNTPQEIENPSYQISKRILELYKEDKLKAWESLESWFSNRDIGVWQEKFGPSNNNTFLGNEILDAHRSLCKENGIHHTPETCIEDYKFPRKYYDYNDLHLLIEDMVADFKIRREHHLVPA